MRILHLEASAGWGGQEIRILREAEGMRQRGHEIVLAVMRGGRLIEAARRAGFVVYELNFKKWAWPFCLFQILQILRRHQIELVNTHSSLDSWIGGIAARLASRPIIRTRHLSTLIKPGFNSRFLYHTLADFVVTTCASILPMICSQSGKKPEHCRSIATGVEPLQIRFTEEEVAQFRAKWGLKEKDFLVGTACFMRSWKGIGEFLKAADQLRHVPHLKWVLIGGGHAKTYQDLAKDLKLEGIVHFTGHLDNPFPALAALDAFALLSTAHEGVSQAILQAAYLGKPLIATPVGGLPEVCLDQKTGLLVPPHASDSVAKAVLQLQENRDFARQLGAQARSLVLERFTFTHTLDQMEEVLRTLNEKRGKNAI